MTNKCSYCQRQFTEELPPAEPNYPDDQFMLCKECDEAFNQGQRMVLLEGHMMTMRRFELDQAVGLIHQSRITLREALEGVIRAATCQAEILLPGEKEAQAEFENLVGWIPAMIRLGSNLEMLRRHINSYTMFLADEEQGIEYELRNKVGLPVCQDDKGGWKECDSFASADLTDSGESFGIEELLIWDETPNEEGTERFLTEHRKVTLTHQPAEKIPFPERPGDPEAG